MTDKRTNRPSLGAKEKKAPVAEQYGEQNPGTAEVDFQSSGDWIPLDTMREAALSVLEQGKDLTVNLSNIGHLDASALQILLALDKEQKNRGRSLHLANASAQLRQWFQYSGASSNFFHDSAEEQ